MREIKFRAWHKTWSPQEIDKNDWHTKGQKINGMQFVKSLGYSNKGSFWVHLSDWASACSASDVELMQFTGLKDKNGKEIYEGDVVKVVYDGSLNGYDDEVHLVEWGNDYPAFDLRGHELDANALCYAKENGEIEVIGNIYENPELLAV